MGHAKIGPPILEPRAVSDEGFMLIVPYRHDLFMGWVMLGMARYSTKSVGPDPGWARYGLMPMSSGKVGAF
ncbi:hypothetical protein COCNU_06G017760 [Cocos nucifera]|uniref:Uncharacterized protein n=1 Tax=Cocos nucifera TaxID=13894 RepID=A0A8K0N4C0_COCNU|nr:hypothetical protein COCNU_06G017760 [Cocos nucifera]